MPLSNEAQALFDHARQALPRWLTGAPNAVLEWLFGFTEIFDEVRAQGQDWLDITYLGNATGPELDQHAADRGTSRRAGESDDSLRYRLRNITDALTEPAIKAAVNALLALGGFGTCVIVNTRRNGGHFHVIGSCTTFLSRGYRMHALRGSYIVILPYPTDQVTAAAVVEYLRKQGPAGYEFSVERRRIP